MRRVFNRCGNTWWYRKFRLIPGNLKIPYPHTIAFDFQWPLARCMKTRILLCLTDRIPVTPKEIA
ncbi:hypothetical protein PCAR4_1360015 [Paraburkholderia caribensis]|nr:hypothetical protein PCAR4_1360015 [Paraburkholderia caribensis]